jgi:hypothetical protein
MKNNHDLYSKKINRNPIIVNWEAPSPSHIRFSHYIISSALQSFLNRERMVKFQEMWWFWKTKTSYLAIWWWWWWWTERQWRSNPLCTSTHMHMHMHQTHVVEIEKRFVHTVHWHTHAHTYASKHTCLERKNVKEFFFWVNDWTTILPSTLNKPKQAEKEMCDVCSARSTWTTK